jgi:hypothetical protein
MMIRKRFILIFLCLIKALQPLTAQHAGYTYAMSHQIPVTSGGKSLKNAWTGGMNNVQFNNIDINSDGLNDLLIFDRTGNKVMPFLNNGKAGIPDFVYRADYEIYFPEGFAIYLTADYNHDGKMDLFTRDESRKLKIYKNISRGAIPEFQDQGDILREVVANPPFNFQPFLLDPGDIPSFTDLDRDGDLDVVFYQNTYGGYAMCRNEQVEFGLAPDSFRFRFVDFCHGYFRESPFANEVFLGECTQPFKWRHAGGSSCLLWDTDDDGDQDMIIGNIGFPNLLFLKNGKSENQGFWDTMIAQDTIFPRNTTRAASYIFPSGFKCDVDMDGIPDLVTAPTDNLGGRERNQVWYYRNNGQARKPIFQFKQDNLLQESMIDLGGNTSPHFWDIDNDGDQDMLVVHNGDYERFGNQKDRIALFRNTGTRNAPSFTLEDEDFLKFSNQSISYLKISIGDLNSDGKPDIVAGNFRGFLRYYVNNTVGSSIAFVLADTNLLEITETERGRYYAAPAFWDYNKDGKLDLLVGAYNGKLELWEHTGTASAPAFTLVDNYFGKIRSNEFKYTFNPPQYAPDGYAVPYVCDLNGDKKPELLLGCVYGAVQVYSLDLKSLPDSLGYYANFLLFPNAKDGSEFRMGSWAAPAAADLDGDGWQEIICGNRRGGLNLFTVGKQNSNTGIDLPEFTTRLFPNPASAILHIQCSLPRTDLLHIYDVSGRLLVTEHRNVSESSFSLDISKLEPGMYQLVLWGGGYSSSAWFCVGE